MTVQHRELANGRWRELSLCSQLANVGSEISRCCTWKEKGRTDYSMRAFERALELLDLTIGDPKNRARGGLRELTRVREALCDFFVFDNTYKSTVEQWRKYFLAFAFAARTGK